MKALSGEVLRVTRTPLSWDRASRYEAALRLSGCDSMVVRATRSRQGEMRRFDELDSGA